MKEKLKLKVQSIDANLHNYIVSYQGENVPVRQYPFQYNLKKPDTLICINTTPGLPIPSLSQDMKTVIEDIYEEDVPYHFSVNKLRRSGENVFDAELRDQYGFTYCYRNAGRKAITVLGKEIELYIHRINEDGTILFYTSKQLTDDSTHLTPTITDDEFNIFRRLSDKRRDAKKVLVDDPDYCGLWKSIIDKYPHRTHFIYELLQNADDVKATTVSFFLFKDGLVFKHNGSVPFSVTDPSIRSSNGHINSITGIGRSTKISNTIGKFGVGFKAVYVYTSRPEIHDDKFHFAIEERIVPVWLGCDHPMRSIGETLFYFPFDNPGSAYNEILEKLKSLENPHLFLNNLQEINWVTEYGEKGCFVKNTLYEFTVKDTCCQHLSIKNNDNDKNLWLFTWNTPEIPVNL